MSLYNDVATLYLYDGNGYNRVVAQKTKNQINKNAQSKIKGGIVDKSNFTAYVPIEYLALYPSKDIHPSENIYPGMDLSPKNLSFDMVVPFECDFIFDNSTQETVANSYKEFKQQYEHYIVSQVIKYDSSFIDRNYFKILAN